MSFERLVLRHGLAVIFVAVVLSVAGLGAGQRLPKGVYPELTFPREQVVATLPGASSESVMAALTRPLEEALVSIPGTVRIRSRTLRETTLISLDFSPKTDMAQGHALVLARLAELRVDLPPTTALSAEQVLPSGFPILSFNVTGPHPPERLYEVAQYLLRPALSALPGVGLVSVQSSDVPEVQILLDPERLAAAHLTVPEVADRLRKAHAVTTVARLGVAHELVLGVVSGELHDAQAIEEVVVGTAPGGAPLRVGDVGSVQEGVEPRTSVIRVDGEPGVILNVARRPGGDILVLHEAVMRTLEALAPSLPAGISLRPAYAQAVFVDDAVKGVRDAVLLGVLLVVGVLAFFLRDWRATLVASLSLPLTLGASLWVLEALGETLNLMTLGGLAVAVGLVIDDAVVVIEAIHRHHLAGEPAAEASRKGAQELLWPVVGTTLTTVVVFLPLGLLGGVAGAFFIALSVALSSAVLLSLPIALLVIPALTARILRPPRGGARPFALIRPYQRVLRWTLERRRLVQWAPLLAAIAAGLVLTRVSTGFLPEADEGAYILDYFAPVGASLEEADAMAVQVESILRETPEVATFSRRLGTELGPATATLSSSGDFAVRLRPDRKRGIEAIMDAQRTRIEALVPGLRVEFIMVLADMLGDLEGSPEPIEVKILGPDPAVLRGLAREASNRLSSTPGLVDFFDGDLGCAPELELRLDPAAVGRASLDSTGIGAQLAGDFLGEVAISLRRVDHLEPVRVRMKAPRSLPDAALKRARVLTPTGESVGLAVLGTFSNVCLPSQLLRENQRNLVHVTARLSGVSLGAAVREVRQRLHGWTLPKGYTWELGGLHVQQTESFRALVKALVLALLAVAGVLLFQLQTLGRTLAVLSAAPLALAGGLATLWLTGVPLNVSSTMGAILLVGLVVKNGILLADHAILAEERGLDRTEAALEAGAQRLRPILMTTLATLLALLPLVLGLGAGASLHRPLALVVVGGLAFSTLGTLLLLPAMLAGRPKRPPPGS